MEILVDDVDYAPSDLERQTPFRARLIRQLPGSDRPDYWLAELAEPISWRRGFKIHVIRHIVVAARWVGGEIRAGATLPIGIAYVTDDTLVESPTFEARMSEYVAIGMARVFG